MQLTLYAGIVASLLGAILFTRHRVRWTWFFFAISQVFGATSIAALTALGGASLAVTQVGVIALLLAAFVVAAPADPEAARRTLVIHVASIAIIAYTVLISALGPRLFAGQIDLIAMRPDMLNGVAVTVPLAPRASNITHMAYLAGSFLTALATSLLFARKLSAADFRNAVLAAGALHVAFGAIDGIGAALGQGRVLDFLRNANFAMVDQAIGNVKRISGSLAEPSAYATFAVPFAVFGIEEWLRSRRAIAGLIGLALWTAIIASTSTTGLISAAVYALVLAPRLVISPGNFGRTAMAVAILAAAGLASAALFLARPDLFAAFSDFASALTVDKSQTQSAAERTAWSLQGWDAFKSSYGLGVGAGSFRSSSLAFATLGSLGVVGSALMLIFVWQVGRAAFAGRSGPTQRSAAWAALFALVPAMVNSPTVDPGFAFALFAGFALHPWIAPSRVAARTFDRDGLGLSAVRSD